MKKQEEMLPSELAQLTVLYSIPGMDTVTVRRDVPYRETETGRLGFDVYYPPGATADSRLPAVLIVHGYSDAGMPNVFGRIFKDMGQPVSWATLIAASGMAAIVYSNREPLSDLQSVLQHLRDHAVSLGIDTNRLGLWAGSGHVPVALWLLMRKDHRLVRCAVLCYGFMLDLHGSTAVADMQKTFRFANPCAGKSVDDVRDDVPLFIVRSGRDRFVGVNGSIDGFVSAALQKNMPVTLINNADAPHAFDLFHDSEASREIIRGILRFMQFHLVGPVLLDGPRSNE
jgi:acetyl esterase/lipase